MKFLTKEEVKACGYVVVGKSRTMPDQALSVKDILNNFASGGYMQYLKDGHFDDQVTFDTMILSDFKDIAELETACANSAHIRKLYQEALNRKDVKPKDEDLVDENKTVIEA